MSFEAMVESLRELVEQNERSPRFQAMERRRAELAAAEHREWLLACTGSCLNGTFGDETKRVAMDVLQDNYGQMRTDTLSLEEAVRQVRQIPPERRQRR